MTARAYALVVALGLSLATGALPGQSALAGVNVARSPADQKAAAGAQTMQPPLPVRWVPRWLMEPLRRAIADATDPHDRK